MATVVAINVVTRRIKVLSTNLSMQAAERERKYQIKRLYEKDLYNDYVIDIK